MDMISGRSRESSKGDRLWWICQGSQDLETGFVGTVNMDHPQE